MKHILRIGLLLGMLVFVSCSDAIACSCFLLPLEEGFKDAGAVFMGKVSKPFEYDEQRFMHWEIEALRVWKGTVGPKMQLISDRADNVEGLSYCMPQFPVGETFMFFTRPKKAGVLETIPCSWTFSRSVWNAMLAENSDNISFWKRQGKGRKPRNAKQ